MKWYNVELEIPIYGKEKRYITPRECARLQSFPDTFKIDPIDKNSYKQFGNFKPWAQIALENLKLLSGLLWSKLLLKIPETKPIEVG